MKPDTWVLLSDERISALLDRGVRDEATGCLLWSGARDRHGYGVLRVNQGTRRVHRLVAEHAAGSRIPSDLDVCHHCDIRACFAVEHLFVGTRRDNMQDALVKGRLVCRPPDRQPDPEARPRGEAHKRSKWTEVQVREMRTLRASGTSATALTHQYGISMSQLLRILRRESWAHVA